MPFAIRRLGTLLRSIHACLDQERDRLRLGLARRDAYRQSYCRLASQSDADLAKGGLTRCDIAAEARQMALSLH